ncbi:MAG: ATP-binding protein, partial [Candidatus Omnitrophica bacterium]|nr:ATP-binding protein [Candidatus Omnitrophota bacterium]
MISTTTSPQIFIGRSEVLEVLNKRVESLKSGYRQNIALTGQKLCGKTSILQQFLANLKDNSLIPVYIEVRGGSLEAFAEQFIGTMLLNFFRPSCEEMQEDLQFLINKAQETIPKTAASIRRVLSLLEKKDYPEAYSSLFNLTSSLREEGGKPCIIILDEFHNLSGFSLKNPFAIFGKKIMVQKDTMYVVTSSNVSSIKKILREKLDLLFGNFEVLEIRDFEFSVSRLFLEKRLEGIKLHDELKDFLIAFTDGRPFYLDIVASKLTDISGQLQFKWLGPSHIAQALEDLLFNSKGSINQYFQNLISTLGPAASEDECMDLLAAISEGKKRLNQMRGSFSGKTADMPARMQRLIDENLVSKNGIIYYFNDRVFEFWVRYVYSKKRRSLVSIFQDRSNIFKKDMETLIAAFIAENRKGAYERVRELCSNFSNEVITISEKSIKFPRFTRVEADTASCPNGELTIKASYNKDKLWIFKLSRKNVDEAVVSEYIERFKDSDPAPQRKILIALEGVDTNAMLLAKEKKIWIWSKETLNLI